MFEFVITRPLGFIIQQIYNLVANYGVSIILFTILIKLVLLPLNIKSQKAMKKQQKIQPVIAELQKKYANDQEKLQREMMKIYKENNISMTGGCLPMLIQMPILVGLYQVIQRPLSYLMGVDFNTPEAINRVIDIQAQMIDKHAGIIGKMASYTMEQMANMGQIQLAKWSEMLHGAADQWVVNFNFLGLDLSNPPSTALTQIMNGNFGQLSIILLLLIPVLAIVMTWLSTKVTQMQSPSAGTDQANQMTKTMNLMMPLMTGFFTFTLPSGMGIYWIISSLMQIVQQVAVNKIFDKKEDEIVVKLPERNNKKGKKRR